MRVLKRAMAATLAVSLTGCAGMGDFCNNQPLICGGVVIAAIAGIIVATDVFEGAPDPPPTGQIPMVSDLRLKRDVRPAGFLSNGVPTYTFRYWNDDRTFIGVVAQDLLQDARFAHAVSRGDGGYYVVDLGALGLAVTGDAAQYRDAGKHAIEAAPPVSGDSYPHFE